MPPSDHSGPSTRKTDARAGPRERSHAGSSPQDVANPVLDPGGGGWRPVGLTPPLIEHPVGDTDGHRPGERTAQARPRKPRSRRLLPTTNTLENAIAAPAIMGVSMPSAASGIAATL